ncbi:MAG: hypothetical protein IJE19_08875 [Clostridia bacterium]|nr:hypothetical protein [Clostridia bacterium]
MLNFFLMIMAFFFSMTSFFTVLSGDNLGKIVMDYDPSSGEVWECKVENENVAVLTDEIILGSHQTFTLKGISSGRTAVTLTNENGKSVEGIFESNAVVNPYNGKTEYYHMVVAYNLEKYIPYDEGITLTAENPVEGGYWVTDTSAPELRTWPPESENGVCTFDVINTSLKDENYAVFYTYMSPDGTPLETQFKAYTLTADGEIVYTDENRLAKIELPSDRSKLIGWELSPASIDSETAEIINIYPVSDTYGSIYMPEDYPSAETVKELFEELYGKMPVGGNDIVVIEALKEGTATFTLEKVDRYPIVETEDGYEINAERYEILETITVEVTVDADLNISYEIR